MPCFRSDPLYSTPSERWLYGLRAAGTGGTSVSHGGGANSWALRRWVWNVHPGTYTIDKIGSLRLADTDAANLSGARLVVGKIVGSAFEIQASWDIFSLITKGAGGSTNSNLSLTPASVTVAAGESWYIGVALHKTDAGDAPKFVEAAAAVNAPTGDGWTSTGAQTAASNAMPTSWTTASLDSSGSALLCNIEFTTANLCVCQVASPYAGSATSLMIPHKTDKNFTVHFRGVTTVNNATFSSAFNRENDGAVATLTTMVEDFGATDQSTFASVNVALASNEAGQLRDLWAQFRPSGATTRGNLIYVCRNRGQGAQGTNDPVHFSHAAKSTASRYTAGANSGQTGYQLDAGAVRPIEFLRLSHTGTAPTVVSISVIAKLVILFGDSMMGSAGMNFNSGTNTGGRLGLSIIEELGLGDAHVNAGRANCALARGVTSTCTAGFLRYNNTPGAGDIADFWGAILFVHFGGNDLKADGGATGLPLTVASTSGLPANTAAIKARVCELAWMVSEILADWFVRNNERDNEAVLISLPPYNDPGQTEAVHDEAFRRWGYALQGLAAAFRVPFCDQRPIVEADTASRQESDGVHLTYPTGSAAVARAVIGAWRSSASGCVGKSASPSVSQPS